MSIVDEFAHLQELHESGALTEGEFTAAKGKVLAAENGDSTPTQDADLQRDVKRLGIQSQILQLDQDWERERETYMVRGRYGSQSIPTQGGSIFGGIFAGAMGLLVLGGTTIIPHAGLLPLIGVALIVVGIGGAISGSSKAGAYQKAEDSYQQRRGDLTAQLDQP